MSGFPPQAFLIGSQKCGTTSLALLLDQNPAICLSEPKEPNYYSVNYARGIDWYRDRFSDPDRILMDASTTYSMCALSKSALELKAGRQRLAGVPERIYADAPNAKFVYIIRNPVDRLYSNYWHNVKYGYENKPLFEAIENDRQYVHQSEYYGQLEKYLEYFPASRILVLKFEDFIKDQQAIVNRVETFLGAPRSTVSTSRNANQGRQYSAIGRMLINNKYSRNLDRYIPARVKQLIRNSLSQEIPSLDATQRNQIQGLFLQDQEKLQQLFAVSYG